MGKRKQKVQWSKVDGFNWSQDEQTDTCASGGMVKDETGPGGPTSGRTSSNSGHGWTSSLAPRFERRAAAEAEQKHIYYEGEFCEAEELPNGFTKIRSKNLDILFKRDYYEQRLAAQQLLSEGLKNLENSEEILKEGLEGLDKEKEAHTSKTVKTTNTDGNMGSNIEEVPSVYLSSQSFDQIDLNEIPEFKPMNVVTETPPYDIDSGHTSPSFCNYPPYHPREYTNGQQYGAPPRPNLYLYSPGNNTLIPCDEIIIPNPVLSPEGPVYSGPTNIYLAYPVQGPDGRGYITQPFLPPGSAGSYMSQDSCSYSPSISYDGSTQYSSTPHTPNSGEDSGSSTQPTSPPPIVNYHPTNWISQDKTTLTPLPKDVYYPNSMPHTEGYYEPQTLTKSTDKPRSLDLPNSTDLAPLNVAASPNTTVTHIPGLPQDSQVIVQKKTQKRRKKKTKTDIQIEHRSSTSSETDILQNNAAGDFNDKAKADIIAEHKVDDFVLEVSVETIQEIHLTDDLADSLVNPPTDPEGSDDEVSYKRLSEITNLKSDQHIKQEEEKRIKQNSFIKMSEAVNTNDTNDTNANITGEMEPEDKEVYEITENIKDKSAFLNVDKNIDNREAEVVNNINPESEIIESKQTPVKSEILPEVPMIDVKEQMEVAEKLIKAECATEKCNVGAKGDSQIKQEDELSSENSKCNLSNKKSNHTVDKECQIFAKKSYSSVIKSSLSTEPNILATVSSPKSVSTVPINNPTQVSSVPMYNNCTFTPVPISSPAAVSVPISSPPAVSVPISSPPAVSVPISSPIAPKFLCPALKNRSEVELDNWQNVPLSNSKSESWKKTTKKRKHKSKNISFMDSSLTHEMPDLEVVEQQKKSKTPVEVEKVLEKKNVSPHEEIVVEVNTTENEIEQEKKKLRKKKKKFGSEDPEESNGGHRVVICDEQISLQSHEGITSSYSDFLLVSELGSGISRGCMNLGRLYQGKYVAPERTDGLIHQPDEEEAVEEEASDQQVIGQDGSFVDSTIIDLD